MPWVPPLAEPDLPEALPSTPFPRVTPEFPDGNYSPNIDSTQDGIIEVPGLPEDRPEGVPEVTDLSDFDPADATSEAKSEFVTDYRLADGSGVMLISRQPQNVRADDGSWVPIVNDAVRKADGSWVADRHPLRPTFPASVGSGEVAKISDGDFDVSFELVGAASSWVTGSQAGRLAPKKLDTLTYPEVFDDVDLTYESAWVSFRPLIQDG